MKLNLGCGIDIKPNYVNLDKYKYPGVDVVCNLDLLTIPYNDDTFDEVLAKDILEHIEYVPLMKELARIIKKGGRLIIRVPHFTYHNAFSDPTHTRFFCCHTFHFFVKQNRKQDSLYGFRHFSKIKTHIEFEKRGFMLWNYPLSWFVNFNNITKELYERTPLRVFPAMNIQVEMIK